MTSENLMAFPTSIPTQQKDFNHNMEEDTEKFERAKSQLDRSAEVSTPSHTLQVSSLTPYQNLKNRIRILRLISRFGSTVLAGATLVSNGGPPQFLLFECLKRVLGLIFYSTRNILDVATFNTPTTYSTSKAAPYTHMQQHTP